MFTLDRRQQMVNGLPLPSPRSRPGSWPTLERQQLQPRGGQRVAEQARETASPSQSDARRPVGTSVYAALCTCMRVPGVRLVRGTTTQVGGAARAARWGGGSQWEGDD